MVPSSAEAAFAITRAENTRIHEQVASEIRSSQRNTSTACLDAQQACLRCIVSIIVITRSNSSQVEKRRYRNVDDAFRDRRRHAGYYSWLLELNKRVTVCVLKANIRVEWGIEAPNRRRLRHDKRWTCQNGGTGRSPMSISHLFTGNIVAEGRIS